MNRRQDMESKPMNHKTADSALGTRVDWRRIVTIALTGLVLTVSTHARASLLCQDVFNKQWMFGLEFTVTSNPIIAEGNRNPKDAGLENNPIKAEAWLQFEQLLIEKCRRTAECTVSRTRDKHGKAILVTFKDGFYFTVGIDSCALEANATPLTPSEFDQRADSRLDEYYFAQAAQLGLTPHERVGQGHIHIERGAFDEDVLLYSNFFVDFQNRPELIFGALGNHLGNSPPMAALAPEQREALLVVLRKMAIKRAEDPRQLQFDFEDGFSEPLTIDWFVRQIHKHVYTASTVPDWGGFTYYQAFNMTRMMKARERATTEIRSFRPQANTKIYRLQIALLTAWINRLRSLKQPIPYLAKSRVYYSGNEIVDSFYQLITQLELPWEEFKILLPENLQSISPTGDYKSVTYDFKEFE